MVPGAAAESPSTCTHTMRYVELFCGAGGTSCGLVDAGWECAGAADWDRDALAVYRRNHSHPAHELDLSQPLPADLAAAWRAVLGEGALVASSPCQTFSTARRDTARGGVNAALTARLAEHARALAPRWVIFENVARAARSDEFAALVDGLRALGYELAHGVVCALDAGVPQRRHRLFLLAARGEGAAARVAAAWRDLRARLCLAPPSMRETFRAHGLDAEADHVFFAPCGRNRHKGVHALDGVAPTQRCSIRPIPPSYVFSRLDTCHDRGRIFVPTPAHAAALQGFPAAYDWAGLSNTARAKCVGNAVPPPLARLVGQAVAAAR